MVEVNIWCLFAIYRSKTGSVIYDILNDIQIASNIKNKHPRTHHLPATSHNTLHDALVSVTTNGRGREIPKNIVVFLTSSLASYIQEDDDLKKFSNLTKTSNFNVPDTSIQDINVNEKVENVETGPNWLIVTNLKDTQEETRIKTLRNTHAGMLFRDLIQYLGSDG